MARSSECTEQYAQKVFDRDPHCQRGDFSTVWCYPASFCPLVAMSSMTASTRSALKVLLRGVSWLLLVVAGLAFWVGGWAISDFAKTDRIFAEMEGITLAVVVGGLGFAAKTAADNLDEG